MLIPVVLSDGHEELVSKEELQFLMDIKQVELFKRSDGWADVHQDKMRRQTKPYKGKERREHQDFSLAQDDVMSLDY